LKRRKTGPSFKDFVIRPLYFEFAFLLPSSKLKYIPLSSFLLFHTTKQNEVPAIAILSLSSFISSSNCKINYN